MTQELCGGRTRCTSDISGMYFVIVIWTVKLPEKPHCHRLQQGIGLMMLFIAIKHIILGVLTQV